MLDSNVELQSSQRTNYVKISQIVLLISASAINVKPSTWSTTEC